jgi:L,D-transpeptidase YbiS
VPIVIIRFDGGAVARIRMHTIDMDKTQLLIHLGEQTLTLQDGPRPVTYTVSTASKGAGCASGSFCTPVGLHRVRAKIGQGLPVNAVFVRRRPTGEIFSPAMGALYPDRDWILSRILWLQGLEPGVNRGPGVDTLRRFIYIHGTNEEQRIGQPASHGCIRMRNHDIVELFDRVPVGALVRIVPPAPGG